jgi:septal ring factor EnvC (AmiA/AmiB activator)
LRNIILILFLIGSLAVTGTVAAQDINKLKSEREKSLNEISQTEELLKKTETSRKNEVQNLRLLNRKISTRENVIKSINKEINILSQQIQNGEDSIDRLSSEIKALKEDYAKVIYKTYLNRNAYHRAQYIFAASDFNQAFKRLKYMQQYARFRKQQAERIEAKSEELRKLVGTLETDKDQKSVLLTTGRKEVASLNQDKKQQESYIKDLQKKEKQLRKDLENQRAVFKKLENEISRIIAAATGSEVSATGMRLTPEMKIISNEFNQNMGRLPWPVAKGVVTMGYGLQNYPGLKNGQIDNKGIDITTEENAPVLAVFAGKVTSIVVVATSLKAILIQHGEYFSVYSNLESVNVKVGDNVKIKQQIGTVGRNNSGSNEIHFEIWKERSNLNPENWLAK